MAGEQSTLFSSVCSKLAISIVPICMIVFGALYHDACPRQNLIPIFLEVMGALSLLYVVMSSLPCLTNPCRTTIILQALIGLVLLAWFIAGNVWIYSIYEPNYNKTMAAQVPYCDRTVYLFAFWTTNAVYIQLGLYVCCFFCCPRFLPSGVPARRT